MANRDVILLFISDRPVLSSLQFSLTIEGFQVIDGAADGSDLSTAAALVIDQNYLGDGLATLRALRAIDCRVPAIVLATNPDTRFRARATATGADLIEKPLLGDELSRAIRAAIDLQKAA